jgi:hypothetical protein
MKTLGVILFITQLVLLLLAALLIGGSFGGFVDSSGYAKAAAIIVILLWGAFAVLLVLAIKNSVALIRDRGSLDTALFWAWLVFLIGWILSIVTGLGIGFLSFVGCGPLWLPSLYHWGGMIGAIVGLAMFFLLPWIVRITVGEGSEYAVRRPVGRIIAVPTFMALIWGLAWLIPYLILKGDINTSDYKAADRVYKLPFPGGESTWVIQGNNSALNHKDSENGQKYSWDLRRRCGTPVLAARDGTVINVTDGFSAMGGSNNQVQIDHGGGIVSYYLHIQQNSAKKFVKVGSVVKQGDQIAQVGSVGNSMTGHIHFMVKKGSGTIAASFTDVREDNGIPRTFNSYTSGNKKVP